VSTILGSRQTDSQPHGTRISSRVPWVKNLFGASEMWFE